MDATTWQPCIICGKPITYGSRYYLCSVSTCNRKRRTYRFCSPDCWDAHLPDMNHRSAECVEEVAPAKG